jgi:PKD repeat protein
VQYSWDFGDGSLPDKGMTITHQYVKTGTFHATVTVTDDQNQQASNSLDILVQGKTAAPQIVLKTDPAYTTKTLKKIITGNVPLTVHFDASATTDKDNDIVDYQWDLDGNGTFETGGSKADYTYNDAGERTVTLKVTDAAKNESLDTVVITTLKQPLAAIIREDVRSGIAPLKVSFDASASRYDQGNIEQFQWDFNDGTPPKMYNAKIQYTFAQPGIYHVKLTVFTNDGKKASTTQDIIVSNVPLIARYTPSIKEGKAPLSVTFDPSSSTGAIVSFFWDFGDGVVSNERQPTHTFEKPGTYTVLLRVQDKDNITDEYTDQITVD